MVFAHWRLLRGKEVGIDRLVAIDKRRVAFISEQINRVISDSMTERNMNASSRQK